VKIFLLDFFLDVVEEGFPYSRLGVRADICPLKIRITNVVFITSPSKKAWPLAGPM
jgi:hypothetical protein